MTLRWLAIVVVAGLAAADLAILVVNAWHGPTLGTRQQPARFNALWWFPVWVCVALAMLASCDGKAPPMEGRCVQPVPDAFDGASPDGPDLRCEWRGRTWLCVHLRHHWRCVATGPAPAESGGAP